MKQLNYLIILFSIFIFSCCNSTEDKKIYAMLDNIEDTYNQQFIQELTEYEEKSIIFFHFSYFLSEYQEISKQNPVLEHFFASLNVNDEPRKAYILLHLLHRHLSHKKLYVKEIVRMANYGKDGVNSCNTTKQIASVTNYNKLAIGNHIQLKFSVSKGWSDLEKDHTVYICCPVLDWEYDPSKDLLIKGKVVDKYWRNLNINSPKAFFIKLKIENINRKDVSYFLSKIQVSDTIEVDLEGYGVTPLALDMQ